MKKVLLTGATGFVGQSCLPLLLAKGFEVHAVSLNRRLHNNSDVSWYQVDLLQSEQAADLVSRVKPTHLLHFAWDAIIPGKVWDSVDNFRWVQASLNLLRAFSLEGGQRAVLAGTCAEYEWNYGYCSEVFSPLRPKSTYGICKHSLQILFDSFAKQTGLSGAWGRMFFLYGPNEHPDRLIPLFIRALLRREPARCLHGDQIRDYLYVQDAANAFVTLLESSVSGPVNIASGCPVTLKDIIYKIADKLNGRDLVQFNSTSIGGDGARFIVADVQRLTQELGWQREHDLDQGLEKTISWWKSHVSI